MRELKALLLGESIFTSMRTIKGEVPGLDMHLKRVFNNCNSYFFNNRLSFDQFYNFYFQSPNLQQYFLDYPNHYLRLTFVSKGSYGAQQLGLCDVSLFMQAEVRELSAKAVSCTIQPGPYSENYLPIKSGSYFQALLGKKNAMARNFDDAIFLVGDEISEATTSNFIFYKDEAFYTPKHASALDGVTVRLFESFCEKNKINFHRTVVKKNDLKSISVPMLINSVQYIRPIYKIDDHLYNTNEAEKMRMKFLNYLGVK